MTDLPKALHELRSKLARVKLEAELLELDGVATQRVVEAINDSLLHLELIEELASFGSGPSPAPQVVLLEDDPRLADVLSRRLSRDGLTIRVVQRVAVAIEYAKSGSVLIADLSILEESTETEQSQLRSLRPIVTTGAAFKSARARAHLYNPAATLIKPVDPVALAELVRERLASTGE